MEEHTGQDLCKTCGMCCDGTIFKNMRVKKHELHLFTRKDTLTLPQPCEHLMECNGCKIYENRPKICHVYKCNLLDGFEANEISFDDAKEIITKTKNNPPVEAVSLFKRWEK